MNEQLFEEINLLKERLIEKNVRLEDLDIASDTLSVLSQSQAKFIKKYNNNIFKKPPKGLMSSKSPMIKKENTYVHKNTGSSPVDIILE